VIAGLGLGVTGAESHEERDPSLSQAPERHRYAWIPFGGGKRGCIGAGFARQEAVLVLARLCRHYRLNLIGPGMPRPRGFVTLRPAGPVRMRLIRRGTRWVSGSRLSPKFSGGRACSTALVTSSETVSSTESAASSATLH
jgi:hypothetical protein